MMQLGELAAKVLAVCSHEQRIVMAARGLEKEGM